MRGRYGTILFKQHLSCAKQRSMARLRCLTDRGNVSVDDSIVGSRRRIEVWLFELMTLSFEC